MLLVMTDGRPVMTAAEVAKLRNIEIRSLLNQVYAGTCPVKMWKDGAGWFAHVSDVAAWVEEQRTKEPA